MNRRKNILEICTGLLLATLLMLITSCGEVNLEGKLVFTSVPSGAEGAEWTLESPTSGYQNSKLMAIDPEDPGREPLILTEDFNSACSPVVSHDGQYLIFSARNTPEGPWQIWMLETDGLKKRQLTNFPEDCTNPVWHPGGRIFFSRSETEGVSKIWSCNLEGEDIRQITFHPHRDIAAGMLFDGRILVHSQQVKPEIKDPLYLAMRPDGTKSELFYPGTEGWQLSSVFSESPEGDILFIEFDANKPGQGRLSGIHQNRPLHTFRTLKTDNNGSFFDMTRVFSGKLIVSYRPENAQVYGISELDPENLESSSTLYQQENFHCLEPILINARDRVRKLPSAVKEDSETGLLLCQDINVTALPIPSDQAKSGSPAAIRVSSLNGFNQDVPAEEDGSVYIELTADTPVRLFTLDSEGNIIHGPSGWFWLRPNERRGCVGCHADPELAPINRVPLAVKNPPVKVLLSGDQNLAEGGRP